MLKLDNISFYYDHGKHSDNPLFKDFNLKITRGEFLSLVGPSGCGKTTLVNIIAGYLKPTGGDVIVDGNIVTSPGKDRIVINQENDLFEWMTVLGNMKIVSKNEDLIKKYLELTHLSDFTNYYPRQLSGGMRKRLSLSRALLVNPKFIIMDEPFVSLDHEIKEKLYEEVLKIIKESGTTVLLVTHDVDEAIFLSERILLISGKPIEIKNEVKIPFSYPRETSIKDLDAFNILKNSITKEITNRH